MKGTAMTIIIFTESMLKKDNTHQPEVEFASTAFEMLVAKKIREQLALTPTVKVVTAMEEQTVFCYDGENNYDEAVKTAIKQIIQNVWTEAEFWDLGMLLQIKDVLENEDEQNDSSRLVRKLVHFATVSHHPQVINKSQEAFRANEEFTHAINQLEEIVDKKIGRMTGEE